MSRGLINAVAENAIALVIETGTGLSMFMWIAMPMNIFSAIINNAKPNVFLSVYHGGLAGS